MALCSLTSGPRARLAKEAKAADVVVTSETLTLLFQSAWTREPRAKEVKEAAAAPNFVRAVCTKEMTDLESSSSARKAKEARGEKVDVLADLRHLYY
jgi:hypothetical protein